MVTRAHRERILIDPHHLFKWAKAKFRQQQLDTADKAAYLFLVQMRLGADLDQDGFGVAGEEAASGWERDTQAPQIYNCLRCCHGGLMERQEFNEGQVLGNLDVVSVAP